MPWLIGTVPPELESIKPLDVEFVRAHEQPDHRFFAVRLIRNVHEDDQACLFFGGR